MDETTIPQHTDLMWPIVEALRELGGSGTISEINAWVLGHRDFSEAQRTALHRGGPQTKLEYRLAWARSYLKGIGVATNSHRGVWALTEVGETLTEETMKRQAKAWNRAHARRPSPNPEIVDEPDEEPTEEDWKDRLLRRLLQLSPAGFERLAQRLLREAGFVNVTVLGRVGDGGIDGVGVYRVSLVSFPIFFQCKRYKGTVGAEMVRNFRGAMAGRGEKGLLITTGRFTVDALAESTRDGAPPVELIDGERLCDLLKEYELGVTVTERVEFDVGVDDAFFRMFQGGEQR